MILRHNLAKVTSAFGQPITDIRATRARRPDLPRFQSAYRDFADLIMRWSHRIWEEKNFGVCRPHYPRDCAVHTLVSQVNAVKAVAPTKIAARYATPERKRIGDVIWSPTPGGILAAVPENIWARLNALTPSAPLTGRTQ